MTIEAAEAAIAEIVASSRSYVSSREVRGVTIERFRTIAEGFAALKAERDEVRANLDTGREFMRTAWQEMNAIRARSGVPLDFDGQPQGIDAQYWSDTVDALARLLGDEAKPWMNGAATELYSHANKSTVAAQDRTLAAEAECERLREALRPFAAAIQKSDQAALDAGFGLINDDWERSFTFEVGTLRRARAALEGNAHD